jgi:hypothetical protein
MFVQNGGVTPKFDAVIVLEGEFKFASIADTDPHLRLTAAYVDSKTGETHGKVLATTIISPKTLESFRAFLQSAEEDICNFELGGGSYSIFGEVQSPRNQAESNQGPQLPPGLGQEEPQGWEEG